jgi:hypothetical protein
MIIEVDVIDLVLSHAAKSVGAGEIPVNSNAGPYVERILAKRGLKKGSPWCAAEVSDTGELALGKRWPLPLTASCVVLGEFAQTHGVLMETPQRGDVFLLWENVSGVWRFAHTGFITSVNPDGTCGTSEGNTNGSGSREGWLHAEKTRHFAAKDRFIRWVDLLV